MPVDTPAERVRRLVQPRAPYELASLAARLSAWDADASDLEVLPDHGGRLRLRLAVAVPSGVVVATVEAVATERTADSVDPLGADAAPLVATPLRLELARDDAPIDAVDADAAVATLRSAWGLDDDLGPLLRAARDDPAFAPIARRFHATRVVRHRTPGEALAWALIRQRTPHRFACSSVRRLRDALGPSTYAHGRRWTAFPTVATLASDDARPGLLAATNNVRKVERLHAAAGTVAALDPAWLRTGPIDDVRRELGRAHGVGAWTVDYVTLLGLGRFERVPWTDTGLAAAVADAYAGGLTLDRATMRMLAARYEGLAGVWAHWLKRARHGWRGY